MLLLFKRRKRAAFDGFLTSEGRRRRMDGRVHSSASLVHGSPTARTTRTTRTARTTRATRRTWAARRTAPRTPRGMEAWTEGGSKPASRRGNTCLDWQRVGRSDCHVDLVASGNLRRIRRRALGARRSTALATDSVMGIAPSRFFRSRREKRPVAVTRKPCRVLYRYA